MKFSSTINDTNRRHRRFKLKSVNSAHYYRSDTSNP